MFTDDSGNLQAIYFQTEDMKETFKAYPELILIDSTYKLNDLGMPLFVLLAVDGNGESEIVSLWFVANEQRSTLSSLLTHFKDQNGNWMNICAIISDKDINERRSARKVATG